MVEVKLDEQAVQDFFWNARERHAIYLRRRAGLPRPWTTDPVMDRYRITNVYRELDKTTKWFRENVRDPMRDKPEVLLATVLFRWFNTIRTGETLFKQTLLGSGKTPWELYLSTGDVTPMHDALRAQGAPWVTGAYMIRSPEGMDKLDGILKSFDDFANDHADMKGKMAEATWRDVADLCLKLREDPYDRVSLHDVWQWLKQFYGQGAFLAYEVVTDLRFTALLDMAPDINTWANPGPGALRGANILLGRVERGRKGRLDKSTVPEAHAVMEALLELSKDPSYWPQEFTRLDDPDVNLLAHGPVWDHIGDVLSNKVGIGWKPGDWPAWEMREPEMQLCEHTKIVRTRLGFGRPRGTYP
jgi:hypothetical protein